MTKRSSSWQAAAWNWISLTIMVAAVQREMHAGTISGCWGAPVLAPNIEVCHNLSASISGVDETLDCCAPPSAAPARDFELPSEPPAVTKVRRPAHRLTQAEAQRLVKAYNLMRALPETDPRSYAHQANIHCAYCNEFYTQFNSTVPLQIHGSWLFFSFHRLYLYFHERILASLLGDPSFALPFWNYDHPDGSAIPAVYVDYPELTDRLRQPTHLPPAVVAVDTLSLGRADRDPQVQLAVNRAAFHWVMVTGATTQYRFFGQPYRAGTYQMPGYGTVETMPHNGVHAWAGDMSKAFLDMGSFATAARDPIFYAHHASIDRLWEAWKNISASNTDIDDPDYLDSEFVFYDENAELVKVKVRDSLNCTKLGYAYEEVDNLWLNDTATTSLSGGVPAQLGDGDARCQLGGEPLSDQPCSLQLSVSTAESAADAKLDDDVIRRSPTATLLVLDGIRVGPAQNNSAAAAAQLRVYLNLPSANASTPLGCTEFAGVFSALVPCADTSLRLPIGSILQELDLTGQRSLVVTLVPESLGANLSISTASIEFESQSTLARANV